MRKYNKRPLALAILIVCMLILAACGKSEEEKAAEEIYNNLDAEGQAAIDQMREEVAAYENGKTTENTESQENLPPVTLDEIMEKTHELSIQDTAQMFWEPEQRQLKELIGDEDFYFLTAAEYDGSGTELQAMQTYEDLNLDLSVTCTIDERDKGIISPDAKDIGAYKVWVENEKDIVGRPTTYIYMFMPSTLNKFDRIYGFIVYITVMQKNQSGREVNDEVVQQFVEKEYEFVTGQLEKIPTIESDITDEETTDEKSVQGETPYGVYECEGGATAYVESWHNEFDVIDIFLNDDEFMTDFEWIEGKTYNLIMPNATSPLATATFDESGNMQITALSDEAKPYEGYYIKTV